MCVTLAHFYIEWYLGVFVAIEFFKSGGVTSPKAFVAGAVYAGIKTFSDDKLDLGILFSESPCTTVGTYTQNEIKSASVVLTKKRVGAGRVRAVVTSSGIANAVVEAGEKDAIDLASLAADHIGIKEDEMAICTTGLIGVELPMALIRSAMPKITLSDQGSNQFARSILTTDLKAKSAAISLKIDEEEIIIGGCVKGSGMIHPNMATMLAFFTTDAKVERDFLSHALKEAVDDTFNMTSVDGDTSPNDTVLLLANGAAGNKLLSETSNGSSEFIDALRMLASSLCKELVADAEGSNRIFSVTVHNAASKNDARDIARTIASSNLVKSAIHGSDPNWGRVIAAAGRAGVKIKEEKVSFYINDICLMENGLPISFHKEAIVSIMSRPEISLKLGLGLGEFSATAWGCELSEEYVTFNSAYTT